MSFFSLSRFRLTPKLTVPEEISNCLAEVHDKLNKKPEEMTEKEREQILAIYNTLYTSSHVIPTQRQATHHTFLTMFTFIFSLLGYSIFNSYTVWLNFSSSKKVTLLVFADIILLGVTYTWGRMLRTSVNFNYILIMVTQALEKFLPVQPLTDVFLVTKKMQVPTNLAEEMSLLPKLLTLLTLLASIVVFFLDHRDGTLRNLAYALFTKP